MNIKNRIIKEANYIIDNDATIRSTGLVFNISKSLVHKDIHLKLKKYNYDLYEKVVMVLNKHSNNKHLLGGQGTKEKYRKEKYEKNKYTLYN